MQLLLIVILALSLAPKAFSDKHHHDHKKKGHVHEHGHAEIDIAVESANVAIVEFRSPSDSVYGFEHEAKTDAQKKQVADAMEKLKTSFADMVIFDKKLECAYESTKLEAFLAEGAKTEQKPVKKDNHHRHKDEHHGEHGETHAAFKVTCKNPLKGGVVTFGASKVFPKIERLKVQVVSEGGQTGGTFKHDKGSVTIK
jgi:hypothetical protein